MGLFRRIGNRFISAFKSRPRGTVRTMFSLSALAILMAAAVIGTENASYIKLTINDSLVEKGGIVSVDVYAFAHVPVNAVDVTLRFDKKAVEVISVDRGQSVLTIWTEDPIIESDKVTLRGGTFRKGFIGEHKLATIELRAKQTGQSQFTIDNVMLLAGDGSGTPITAAESNQSTASLYIYDENTSPEDIGIDVKINVVSDLDGDGKVTLKDISAFMAAWTDQNRIYDFNGDGRMSFRDFSIILADFFLGG